MGKGRDSRRASRNRERSQRSREVEGKGRGSSDGCEAGNRGWRREREGNLRLNRNLSALECIPRGAHHYCHSGLGLRKTGYRKKV